MKGTVIHYEGRFRRILEGRNNNSQIKVEVQTPELPLSEETEGTLSISRPAHFTFYVDGQSFAASRKVTLAKGRRYPHIEHWFVAAD